MDKAAAKQKRKKGKGKGKGKGKVDHHQPISAVAAGGDEDNDKEKNFVYICFPCNGDIPPNYGWDWAMLDLEKEEVIPSPLPRIESELTLSASATVALGPTIYIIGGLSSSDPASAGGLGSERFTPSARVLRSDTRHPHKGWKDAPSMIHPRSFSAVAAVDGKICVFGGGSRTESSFGEVFDPDKQAWSPLTGPEGATLLDHPVLSDPSNGRIIVHLRHRKSLYTYYPKTSLWECLNPAFAAPQLWYFPSVVMDDVMYTALPPYHHHDLTRCLSAYDLVANQYLDTVWSDDDDFDFPDIEDVYSWTAMLHLGNGKLCLVMSGHLIQYPDRFPSDTRMIVRCMKFEVHKEPGGRRVLATRPSIHSLIFEACSPLDGFLALK